jgi:hypothetical protein
MARSITLASCWRWVMHFPGDEKEKAYKIGAIVSYVRKQFGGISVVVKPEQAEASGRTSRIAPPIHGGRAAQSSLSAGLAPGLNLRDRPARVFSDQWLGRSSAFLNAGSASVAHISQSDADIAQQSPALSCATSECPRTCFETSLIKLQQFHQIGGSQIGRACDFIKLPSRANLFHGHAARQSSQP